MTTLQNDIIEVSARMEFDGVEDVINAYQYQMTSAAPTTDAITATDLITIMELLYVILNSFLPVIQVYRDITLRNKTQGTLLGSFPWPTLVAGTGTGGPIPPGCSGMASFATGIPNVTLRKYWGSTTQDFIGAGGFITAAGVTVLTTAAAFMIAPKQITLPIWQYGHLSAKTLAFQPPVAAIVTNVPAYQRRRKQGSGS